MLDFIFKASSDHFFKSISTSLKDKQLIRSAQKFFLTQSALNLFLYYGGFGLEAHPKFPATISFTIRGGLPLYSNMLVWTAGWTQMMRVLLRKGDTLCKIFATQMYCVGFSTVYLFPVGAGGTSDLIHGACAGLYFIYHIVLFKYLRTTTPYKVGFYTSFALFLFSLSRIRRIEKNHQFRSESNAEGNKQQKRSLPPVIRRKLWWHELLLMVSENTMFVSFLLGMTSSL
jgi:hypothetical protein